MPITYQDDGELMEDIPGTCNHTKTCLYKGQLKCVNCGAVYDEILMEWGVA